jgi:hypothetical protein
MPSLMLALLTLKLLLSTSSSMFHALLRRLCRPVCRLSLLLLEGPAANTRGLPPDMSPLIDSVLPLSTLMVSADLPPIVEPCNEARSPATERPPIVDSKLLLRTDSGSDSREPPKTEEGANARTEASVSNEWRLWRFDDEASVMMEALSVQIPWAVAAL